MSERAPKPPGDPLQEVPSELRSFVHPEPQFTQPGEDPVLDAALEGLRGLGREDPLFPSPDERRAAGGRHVRKGAKARVAPSAAGAGAARPAKRVRLARVAPIGLSLGMLIAAVAIGMATRPGCGGEQKSGSVEAPAVVPAPPTVVVLPAARPPEEAVPPEAPPSSAALPPEVVPAPPPAASARPQGVAPAPAPSPATPSAPSAPRPASVQPPTDKPRTTPRSPPTAEPATPPAPAAQPLPSTSDALPHGEPKF